jgi:hypothetical protein
MHQPGFVIPSVSVTTPHFQHTMPLVVPGLMSNDKDKTSHWQNELMGKKLGDTSDETVRNSPSNLYSAA